MSLTDPNSNVLNLFQCSAGVELSANQFLFWKNVKSPLHLFPILYFLNEKNRMQSQLLDQHMLYVNILHDYGLWWSRTTVNIEYSSKVSDQ